MEKKKTKNPILTILEVVVKIALAACLFVVTWNFLTPYFRKDRNLTGEYYRNVPEDTMDVLCLGSSHMQYAFNPAVFYTDSGYYSYVLGSPCQPIEMSYSLLKEALKTQHPQVVLLDVFTLLEQSIVCYGNGMYYVAIQETTGDTWKEASDLVPDKDKSFAYKYDLFMNHSNWKTMDLSKMKEIIESAKPSTQVDEAFGYVRQEPEVLSYTPVYTYERQKTVTLSDHQIEMLDAIVNLCKENDITPIFIKTPYIIDQESTDQLYAIWDYCESRNIEYIDYIQKADELHWFIDMDGDTWHNNSWGAQIVTHDLATYILENHLVSKHQDNSTVDELLQEGRKVAAYSLMNEKNVNIYDMLVFASKYPCVTVVKYTGHARTSIGEYENQLLQEAGMNHDFIEQRNQDYYAVIVNGEVVQESDTPFEMDYKTLHISITNETILINGQSFNDNPGELEIYFMADDLSWINPIGIDYATRWFWKNGCDGIVCE